MVVMDSRAVLISEASLGESSEGYSSERSQDGPVIGVWEVAGMEGGIVVGGWYLAVGDDVRRECVGRITMGVLDLTD